MYIMRLWSVRNAAGLEKFYQRFEGVLKKLARVLDFVGHDRLDKPLAFIERRVKGLLFDCQMCGQCVLSSTGMSCPMNCPKQLRNGPCGGVRVNGHCEVQPTMRCVWVEAFNGSQRMVAGRDKIHVVQLAVDRRLQGSSSWLRQLRQISQAQSTALASGAAPKAHL